MSAEPKLALVEKYTDKDGQHVYYLYFEANLLYEDDLSEKLSDKRLGYVGIAWRNDPPGPPPSRQSLFRDFFWYITRSEDAVVEYTLRYG